MTEQRAKWWRERIELAASTMSDKDAVDSVELFHAWESNVEYDVGNRVQYNGKLYKCRQAHTSQDIYTPDIIPALWAVVDVEDGSREHPKHYSAGMELEEGLYYTENDILYYCFRATGTPVYNALADLVNLYVNVVTD